MISPSGKQSVNLMTKGCLVRLTKAYSKMSELSAQYDIDKDSEEVHPKLFLLSMRRLRCYFIESKKTRIIKRYNELKTIFFEDVISSVATFHDVSFQRLTGKGSNLITKSAGREKVHVAHSRERREMSDEKNIFNTVIQK